jgi:hypothetical protein
MTTFDDREKSYEKKFALDQELMFKAHARRDKLFGIWAAGRLGLSDAAAEVYAKGIVSEDIIHPGDKAIAQKVAGDLSAKGVKVAEGELSAKLDELFATAKQQIATEAGK